MNKRIYLSPPHMSGYELKYIQDAFETNWIAPVGPNVNGFEEEICNYVGVNHGLALTSGTAGIHLALRYFGVGPGDTVFCSDLTFAGSCNPIMYQYATPVFIDSKPNSWNMSPESLEKAFEWAEKENKMPKAVIIVDLYGQSADWDELLPICKEYNVPVIEDAAEALGAIYKGKHCGSFGDIGVFSFNGNKIITTSGGGMVVSNDKSVINKMRFWSTQARENELHYEHKEYGYNYRMSNICAGIGRGQLIALNDHIIKRKVIQQKYQETLNDLEIEFMPINEKGEPNYWLTVITLNKGSNFIPNDIIVALEKEDIESRPVWKPMHLQPIFRSYPFFSHLSTGSVSEDLFNRGVCLPSGSSMSKCELDRVIDTIRTVLNKVILT